MSTITNNSPQKSLLEYKEELDALYKDLGIKDIKYLPSPKENPADIKNLTKHAISMLKLYKRYKQGETSVMTEISVAEIAPE